MASHAFYALVIKDLKTAVVTNCESRDIGIKYYWLVLLKQFCRKNIYKMF